MTRLLLSSLLIAGMLPWLAPSARVCAAGPLEPQSAVLVLRNGEVLCGRVTQEGDRYVVTLGRDGEIRVPKDRVEMLCLTLDEVYQRKRAMLTGRRADEHLALADWCLRNSLPSPAADELLMAMALDSRHPRIPLLERRLHLSVHEPGPTATPQPRPVAVSTADSDRILRELPARAVEDFTVFIQPLLLNRCAAAACHGTGSESGFQLFRPSWGKTIPQRLTQRNLIATLQHVDRGEADRSRLLTKPQTAHGPLTTAVFTDREQQQFDLLADWVRRIATPKAPPTTIEVPPTNLSQAAFHQARELPSTNVRTVAYEEPLDTQPSVVQPTGGFVPKDAFDPEIFNRRYHLPEADRGQ